MHTVYPGSPSTFCRMWFQEPPKFVIIFEAFIWFIIQEEDLKSLSFLYLDFQGIVFPYLSYNHPQIADRRPFWSLESGRHPWRSGGVPAGNAPELENISMNHRYVELQIGLNMLKKKATRSLPRIDLFNLHLWHFNFNHFNLFEVIGLIGMVAFQFPSF